jgi:hypothetical protein
MEFPGRRCSAIAKAAIERAEPPPRTKQRMPRLAKVTKRSRAFRIMAGLAKHFPVGAGPHRLGGVPYDPEQLAAVFQAQIDAVAAVDAARAALTDAVARERAAARRATELTRDLKMVVRSRFGFSAARWAEFGWELPKKPGPKTVKAKLQGADKARATRKARGTMGKRQRKKVRGW